ncbi:hypothetical protein [Klebsiella pneumoniae]|uniref:hypothetical protein n=1 Tax=Klebsiella pneumoniae TaxID=573 RepID=UPI00202173C9|nr:hypothetical protein [Klebsiella pneumoniae]MCL7692195.1 hypothetical protein [Klebsiella pneumoniae]
MYKKTLSLLGVALVLSAFASQAESERQASRERIFASQAESERQASRERIVEQVLKPCEGKKAGDKMVITDRRGGEHEAICTLTAVPLPE